MESIRVTSHCKHAGTLRTAATPKGQITEELPLLPPRLYMVNVRRLGLHTCFDNVLKFL